MQDAKKIAKNRHLGTIVKICRAISSQLRHVSTIGKKVLSSDMSSTCPHNMVNVGLLTAETDPVVWGTPTNFNGFWILAALLHGILHDCKVFPALSSLPRQFGVFGRHLLTCCVFHIVSMSYALICWFRPTFVAEHWHRNWLQCDFVTTCTMYFYLGLFESVWYIM